MQLIYFIIIITSASFVMSANTNRHHVGPEWLFVEPLGIKDTENSIRDKANEITIKSQQGVLDNVKLHVKKKTNAISFEEEGNANNIYKLVEHNSEGVRKKQWHNYPRTLDKLERFKRDYGLREIEQENETPTNESEDKLDSVSSNEEVTGDNDPLIELERYLIDGRTTQHLIFLRNAIKNYNRLTIHKRYNIINDDEGDDDDLDPAGSGEMKEAVPEYPIVERFESLPAWRVDPEMRTIYVTRGRLPSSQSPLFYGVDLGRRHRSQKRKRSDSSHQVSKRIFSFLTRMHGMHSAKDMEYRRHFHAYGGYPTFDSNGDIVSAETRALMRPPGSPLRWG